MKIYEDKPRPGDKCWLVAQTDPDREAFVSAFYAGESRHCEALLAKGIGMLQTLKCLRFKRINDMRLMTPQQQAWLTDDVPR